MRARYSLTTLGLKKPRQVNAHGLGSIRPVRIARATRWFEGLMYLGRYEGEGLKPADMSKGTGRHEVGCAAGDP